MKLTLLHSWQHINVALFPDTASELFQTHLFDTLQMALAHLRWYGDGVDELAVKVRNLPHVRTRKWRVEVMVGGDFKYLKIKKQNRHRSGIKVGNSRMSRKSSPNILLTLTPESSSSSATEPTATCSSPSSLTHMGIGVPQKRLRDTAQSLAPSNLRRRRIRTPWGGRRIRTPWGGAVLLEKISLVENLARVEVAAAGRNARNMLSSNHVPHQFWKRFSFTKDGTQYDASLLASKRALMDSTATNHDGTAL